MDLDLLCIGDAAIDLFMQVDAGLFPVSDKVCFYHGTKIPVEKIATFVAGNATNVSVGASTLGLNVGLYTEVGEDHYGNQILTELRNRKVNTRWISKVPKSITNVHVVIVHDKERTIFTHHESRDYKLLDWPTSKWIFYSSLANGFAKFQAQLTAYKEDHHRTGLVFNPGTFQLNAGLDSLRDILKVTDVLILNREEAFKLLVGKIDVKAALPELHKTLIDLGPKITVITDGVQGASCFDGETLTKVGLFDHDVKISDTTGAGDAFTSGFVSALFYNQPLKEAMKWGAINASFVIRVSGSINGLLTREEIVSHSLNFKA
jgi:sugar/nucleoside kinase (ribokinase family)